MVCVCVHVLQRGGRESPRGRRTNLGVRNEFDELFRGAGLAEEDEQVILANDADVTMKGVGGVEEHRLGARGDESHGNFLRNETRLADAAKKDGALAVQNSLRHRKEHAHVRQG